MRFAGIAALVVAASFAVVVAVGRATGHEGLIILTGSMEPTLSVGSLAIARAVPAEMIVRGDVIAFRRPDRPAATVTHRVVAIEVGAVASHFATQGDANNTADSWRVRIDGQFPVVVASIPYAGYALAYLQSPATRLGVGLAVVLLASANLLAWRGPRLRIIHAAQRSSRPTQSSRAA